MEKYDEPEICKSYRQLNNLIEKLDAVLSNQHLKELHAYIYSTKARVVEKWGSLHDQIHKIVDGR